MKPNSEGSSSEKWECDPNQCSIGHCSRERGVPQHTHSRTGAQRWSQPAMWAPVSMQGWGFTDCKMQSPDFRIFDVVICGMQLASCLWVLSVSSFSNEDQGIPIEVMSWSIYKQSFFHILNNCAMSFNKRVLSLSYAPNVFNSVIISYSRKTQTTSQMLANKLFRKGCSNILICNIHFALLNVLGMQVHWSNPWARALWAGKDWEKILRAEMRWFKFLFKVSNLHEEGVYPSALCLVDRG